MALTPEEQASIRARARQDAAKELMQPPASLGGQATPQMPDDLKAMMHTPSFLMATRQPSDYGDDVSGTIKQQILPNALGALGAGAGGVAAGLTGGALAPLAAAGMGLGSGAGELANQLLGVGQPSGGVFDLPTDPLDLQAVGTATALPMAFAGLSQLARLGHNLGPKAGPIALNARAADEAKIAMGKIGLPEDFLTKARAHFNQATQVGGRIPAKKVMTAINEWAGKLTGGSAGAQEAVAPVKKFLQKTKDLILQNGNQIKPNDIQAELHHYDTLIDSVRRQGGPGMGAYQAIRGALADDLHEAADAAAAAYRAGKFKFFANPVQAQQAQGGAGAAAIVQARDAWMKGTALKDMAGYVEKALKTGKGQGLDPRFDANVVIDKLKRDKFFLKAFDAQEQQDLLGTLGILNKIAAMQPQQGVNTGSRRLLREAALGGLGGTLMRYATENPVAIGIAAIAGASAPPLYETARNLTTALQMQTGREFVSHLLLHSMGRFTPEVSNLLGAYVNSMLKIDQPTAELGAAQPPQGLQP